jgi:hypothetical protein
MGRGRGFGDIQRAVIAGLQPAMVARRDGILRYPGCGWNAEQVRVRGQDVTLSDDEYDLRAVMRFLAYGKPAICGSEPNCDVEETFQRSFSRAAHALHSRGILISSELLRGQHLRIVRLSGEAPMFRHPMDHHGPAGAGKAQPRIQPIGAALTCEANDKGRI